MQQASSTKLVGEGPDFNSIIEFVKLSSRSNAPILLLGEMGAGKEITARSIHLASSRKNQPFLVVDCSLYYERELERELFGIEERAPGGPAEPRGDAKCEGSKGLLEFSARGTCYLANAEELSPLLQERLFNYLDTGFLQRVGSTRPIPSRVRLVFSSAKDMRGFVDGGLFSPKLFNCMHGLLLDLPPLRKHPDDIPIFIRHFLEQWCREKAAQQPALVFSQEAVQAFKTYPWPGNYDELRNELLRISRSGLVNVRPENLNPEIAHYWLGRHGEPQIRRIIDELEGYIQEFRLMAKLDEEYGDVLLDHEGWLTDKEPHNRLP